MYSIFLIRYTSENFANLKGSHVLQALSTESSFVVQCCNLLIDTVAFTFTFLPEKVNCYFFLSHKNRQPHAEVLNDKNKFDENLKVEDSLIYKHLKTILCNNDDKTFEYMTNVLSRILNICPKK